MKTTEEKNRMIAEFMGHVRSGFNGELVFNTETREEFEVEQLKYHTSWEWLMPVVEKIEKLGYDFEIHREWATITDMTDINNFKMIQLNELDKKESTYCCVIEFIEWYNENK